MTRIYKPLFSSQHQIFSIYLDTTSSELEVKQYMDTTSSELEVKQYMDTTSSELEVKQYMDTTSLELNVIYLKVVISEIAKIRF